MARRSCGLAPPRPSGRGARTRTGSVHHWSSGSNRDGGAGAGAELEWCGLDEARTLAQTRRGEGGSPAGSAAPGAFAGGGTPGGASAAMRYSRGAPVDDLRGGRGRPRRVAAGRAALAAAARVPEAAACSLSMDELRRLFVYAWADGASRVRRGSPRADDAALDRARPRRRVVPRRDADDLPRRRGRGREHPLDARRGGRARRLRTARSSRARWQAGDVLAHLVNAGKNEALVDPDDVSDVRAV